MTKALLLPLGLVGSLFFSAAAHAEPVANGSVELRRTASYDDLAFFNGLWKCDARQGDKRTKLRYRFKPNAKKTGFDYQLKAKGMGKSKTKGTVKFDKGKKLFVLEAKGEGKETRSTSKGWEGNRWTWKKEDGTQHAFFKRGGNKANVEWSKNGKVTLEATCFRKKTYPR